jgi:hypothetical protein
MCFACSSHFAEHYLSPSGASRQAMAVQMLSMLASPTFMIVSGALVGYMNAVRPQRFVAFRAKLVDRGAFLLLVGHLLILVPKLIAHPQVPPHTWVFITDVIGLSVVTVPWLVPALDKRLRFWLGMGLYAFSLLLMCLFPASDSWRSVPGLVWGSPPLPTSGQLFPVMPWVSVYLVGTALGEQVAEWRALGGDLEVAKRLWKLGTCLIVCALIAWRAVRSLSPLLAGSAPLGAALTLGIHGSGVDWSSPWQKLPPGPAYLAMQSGLGLSLLATLAALQDKHWMRPIFSLGVTLGRASLFVFVLQFYVYNILMRPIRNTYTQAWPLLLLLSIGLLVLAARIWNRRNLNAYLTLGLEKLLSPRTPGERSKETA